MSQTDTALWTNARIFADLVSWTDIMSAGQATDQSWGSIMARKRREMKRDKVGNVYADVPGTDADASLRVSFRRRWYSPPHTKDGAINYRQVANELAEDFSGGTIVLRNYLETGDLSYSTEICVESKDELERLLRTIRKVFKEGLSQDNAARQAGLEECEAKLANLEKVLEFQTERRQESERRHHDRRVGSWMAELFRKRDRRSIDDRRTGMERRAA